MLLIVTSIISYANLFHKIIDLNMKKTLLVIIPTLFGISSAQAASTTGTANAKVVTPISISAGAALEFGSFAAGATPGTITQSGVTTGGVTAVSSGATRSAGTFSVTGQASTAYTFTLPATVTLNGPSASTMTANLSLSSGTASRTLSAGGTETVSINGTLSVAASQLAGDYTGTYTVTTVY